MTTTDSNGIELEDGDTVMVIKDLKVKGMSRTVILSSLGCCKTLWVEIPVR